MPSDTLLLEYDGPVAIMSNNRPDKHNAANDEMDARLWEILAELRERPEVRSIVWRANGKSWSSGRDVGQIGVRTEDISNLDFIERGHSGTMDFFRLQAPIVCALKGWVIGGSFERALLCDLRVAAESTRFMLPEVKHGVITDTGGMARLFQMAGHGVAMDLILTGRTMHADEALRHGIVSRVVPDDEIDSTALEIAREIAQAPAFTVKMARRNMDLLASDEVIRSIREEATTQTLTFASDDYAEMKEARAAGREPKYRRR
ncbi:MAG: enoyl-CoA hydratase/isomerase family protein [Proteobacteria bacterium]|nr:enoyl-CoA hydratase/isomerase family protein [Pseudomonadota bacterium]